MLLIPAIDLKDGACVRLRQGRMEDDTVFSDNPVEMAGKWVAAGGRRLHLVDLNGAFAGEPVNGEVIRAIAKAYPDVPIQVGGGIRDEATIQAYLDAGVTWCIIGTQAVKDPDFVARACKAFPGHVMVGLDAKDGMVAVEGWAEVSDMPAVDLAKKFEDAGVSAIVYTDISRDGMLEGPATGLYRSMLARLPGLELIASGGVSGMEDVEALAEMDVFGIIIGKAIYEGKLDVQTAIEMYQIESEI